MKIRLPKSLRKLMIGKDKTQEGFGLSSKELTDKNGQQAWIKIKPKIKKKESIFYIHYEQNISGLELQLQKDKKKETI